MKKLLLAVALAVTALSANAEGWRHGGGHYVYRGGGWGWVPAVVVGGAIVYEATRPTTVVVQQPVPVGPPPATVPPQAPYGYHWEAVLDANCNCYRTVLMPN